MRVDGLTVRSTETTLALEFQEEVPAEEQSSLRQFERTSVSVASDIASKRVLRTRSVASYDMPVVGMRLPGCVIRTFVRAARIRAEFHQAMQSA